jgi:cytochrome c biogenesis protein CcdA
MRSKGIGSIILVFLILFLPLRTSFSTQENKICLFFFFGTGCLGCARVEPQISQLQQKYPQLDVHSFEIYGNSSNLQLLNNLFDRYKISQEQRKIPAVFISNTCLTGDKQILDNLEEVITASLEKGCPCPLLEEGGEELTPISLLVVTGAALASAVNPCAMAILIFLLGLLSASNDRKRLIKSSTAFIASIYLSYSLLGIGLLSIIQITGLSYWLYRIIGVFAIAVGLLNLKDYLRPGSLGFAMEIPRSLRPRLTSLLKMITSPLGAFITGFSVSLFELPCTGGPYLLILGMVAEKTTRTSAIPILLYYNLIFIVPLILITLLVYLRLSPIQRIADWEQKSKRTLHLAIGIAMTTLGTIMTLNPL